jgi:hypothetical protein
VPAFLKTDPEVLALAASFRAETETRRRLLATIRDRQGARGAGVCLTLADD